MLQELHPISFACAVNPDHATGAESAEQLWEEMTGVPVEGWHQSRISLAFLDAALPVARERVGDIEIEPAKVEQDKDFDMHTCEIGLALGSKWEGEDHGTTGLLDHGDGSVAGVGRHRLDS